MAFNIDDTRISGLRPLLSPVILSEETPIKEEQKQFVANIRSEIADIIQGRSEKLVCFVGPCSIHDPKAAMDYAQRLKVLADKYAKELLIVMRVYFEKPRSVVGWKGLINDPDIDGSFQINKGLRLARQLLLDVLDCGLPTATEFLDTIIPQFLADAVCWAAIGARTTESQVHRELASGLSMPIGFKNGTSGSIQIAIDAIRSAKSPHVFPGVTKQGLAAIFNTLGNDYCHLILRGGLVKGKNYDAKSVAEAVEALKKVNLSPHVVVDCSHENSNKDYRNQKAVASDISKQIAGGSFSIAGIMLESNLVEGRQDYSPNKTNVYGQSITDSCIDLDTTEEILEELADAIRIRHHLK